MEHPRSIIKQRFPQFRGMFLPESDNESVPSPVKPQLRVPYCKTYEEIRLEEIQAESAAYYSYKAEDYQSDAGDGKIKTRRTKQICRYLPMRNDSSDKKELDFEVLSLDEIRRRKYKGFEENKIRSTESMDSINTKESTECLKDAVETEAEFKEAISVRGVKRHLKNVEEDTSKCKVKCNNDRSAISSSVPPVKLRRSPKRLSLLHSEERDGKIGQEEPIEEKKEGFGRNSPESSSIERLNESNSTSSNSRPRKNEVEVRLCDSSTNEDQVQLEISEEKKSVDTYNVVDSKEADSLLNENEEDYLTLDTSSDDILKDIDALLKDKTWRRS